MSGLQPWQPWALRVSVDQPGRLETSAEAPQVTLLYLRVLNGEAGAAQLWFDQRVLDRYRAQDGARVIRTDSAGRVRASAGWSLDFGISPDARLIHAAAADLAQRLPATERQHWAAHGVVPGVGRNFLVMRLGAGSCIDDGEVRDWPD